MVPPRGGREVSMRFLLVLMLALCAILVAAGCASQGVQELRGSKYTRTDTETVVKGGKLPDGSVVEKSTIKKLDVSGDPLIAEMDPLLMPAGDTGRSGGGRWGSGVAIPKRKNIFERLGGVLLWPFETIFGIFDSTPTYDISVVSGDGGGYYLRQ